VADAAKVLGEILDHFQKTERWPSDDWAFDDDYSSLCLDHQSRDGSKFWLDIERDGTLRVMWKSAGGEVNSLTFVHREGDS